MLITDKFIFIHIPKTGGTFINKTIQEVHKKRYDKWYFKIPLLHYMFKKPYLHSYKSDNLFGEKTYHNNIMDIPSKSKSLPVLCSLRSPFSYYPSYYNYIKEKAKLDKTPTINTNFHKPDISKYPNYPNISFDEFINFSVEHLYTDRVNHLMESGFWGNAPKFKIKSIGILTARFFYHIATSKNHLYQLIYNFHIKNNDPSFWFSQIEHLNIINLEALNQELFDFLSTLNYGLEEIRFILDQEKIFPYGISQENSEYNEISENFITTNEWVIEIILNKKIR